ncbi:rhomboid family intramembrane serine protease GlpG [Saliniradius amylolyticus]|nr:rhomboid family intramembrane serine protease GlpG [Saliniradius amylolyticus]
MTNILAGFKTESHARVLMDYLRSQNIGCHVECDDESEYSHQIILADATDGNRARHILDDFLHNPHQAKFQQAAWRLGTGIDTGSQAWLGINLKAAFWRAPLTWLILASVLLVFLQAHLVGMTVLLQHLHFQPISAVLENGELWRLGSPILLHFSPTHLIFNLFWWGLLGQRVERILGRPVLLLVLVLTAFISNYVQYLLSGANFGGLSGVVYGLMGFVWWCGWLRPQLGLSLDKPLVGFMLIWLVLGYTDLLWVNVANGAHTAGLISGCLLAFIFCRRSLKT